MLGYANGIPAANLFAPRWTPYLGQVIAPLILPAAAPKPASSQELPYGTIVAIRSLDFGVGAVVGGIFSLALKAVFPFARWSKQQGTLKIMVGAGVGIVGSLIPVGGLLNALPLVGGYMVGSGVADQILPKKKTRRA